MRTTTSKWNLTTQTTKRADDMLNSTHMQLVLCHTHTSNQHAAGSTPQTRSNNIYTSAAMRLRLCHFHVTLISDMFDSSSFLRNASSVSNALTISLRYLSYSKPKFWKWNDVTWVNYWSCWCGASVALCVSGMMLLSCVYVCHSNKSHTTKHWHQRWLHGNIDDDDDDDDDDTMVVVTAEEGLVITNSGRHKSFNEALKPLRHKLLHKPQTCDQLWNRIQLTDCKHCN